MTLETQPTSFKNEDHHSGLKATVLQRKGKLHGFLFAFDVVTKSTGLLGLCGTLFTQKSNE
jgi:hypothetical protein